MGNMLDTDTPPSQRWLNDESEVYDRLNWLIATNLREASRQRLFRKREDEEQVRLMRRPIPTERAYALFGLLLGALPTAAILYRFFHYAMPWNSLKLSGWTILCLLMNLVCLLVGRKVGAKIGRRMDQIERRSWSWMIVLAAFEGALWAIATGAAGGAVAFGIGAIVGASLAIPVGIAAFVLFTILHRLVARGGMIDARHFWPLACGVATLIAALIL